MRRPYGPDPFGGGRQVPEQRRGGDRPAPPPAGRGGYPAEYRFAPDGGQPDPAESRYAALESDYPRSGESRYAALDPGYVPPESGYPGPTNPAGESRYRGLGPQGYAAPPPAPPVPPPVVPPSVPLAPPVPPPPVVARPLAPPSAPIARPGADPIARPGIDPVGRPGADPIARPGIDPVGRPGIDPVGRPGPDPVGRPGADPSVAGRATVGRVTSARPTPEAGFSRPGSWRRGRAESETERAIGVLRREIGGPRVVAFANPKGGVHKTTATVLAAATIGSVRGQGVVAWDDNELRGTLGLRAGSARHARTIRHLIADLVMIEASQGAELTARLDDFLRHAADGSYDVLAGEETPSFANRLDQHTVRRVLDLLRRTHQVICVDTGNNVESANWQTVLRAADQLVVTTVPREDAAFTADWMLDVLHETGLSDLADNAVTLLSCPTPGRSPLLGDLERHFATRTRAVAVVPYDPALETGSSIEYGQLQPATKDAWYRAASMIIEPFAR
ncbi:MinD/ParA family ATP-binding protein [Micromonospora zhanjiangensis]